MRKQLTWVLCIQAVVALMALGCGGAVGGDKVQAPPPTTVKGFARVTYPSAITTSPGSTVRLQVDVTTSDSAKTPISGAVVTLKLGGIIAPKATDGSGTAIFDFEVPSDWPIGTTSGTVTVAETAKYSADPGPISLIVQAAGGGGPSTPQVVATNSNGRFGETIEVAASYQNSAGEGIAGLDVTFTSLAGSVAATTDSSGRATMNLTIDERFPTGQSVVSVVSKPTSEWSGTSSQAFVAVSKWGTSLQVTAPSQAEVGSDVTIVVAGTRADGLGLDQTEVQLSGLSNQSVLLENGAATVSARIGLVNPGTYTLQASSSGNTTTEPSSSPIAQLNVVAGTPVVVTKDLVVRRNSSGTFTCTTTSANGTPIPGLSVRFKIADGGYYPPQSQSALVTNSSGRVSTTVAVGGSSWDLGVHQVTASIGSSASFKSATAQFKLTITN